VKEELERESIAEYMEYLEAMLYEWGLSGAGSSDNVS
jgi:hypothetical protein